MHPTTLENTVWNTEEDFYEGSWQRLNDAQSVHPDDANPPLRKAPNFDFSTLQTAVGRIQAAGVSSAVRPGKTEEVGLLGVTVATTGIDDKTLDQLVVQPMLTAGTSLGLTNSGVQGGFAYWDPSRH